MAVSEIAFGGVEIGLPYGIGVNSEKDMLSDREAIHLLHAAADAGVNFFDTARLYGKSEDIIGAAFRDRRDQVIIATKCRSFRDAEGKLPSSHQLQKLMEDSLQQSLEALRTDYVDVFMLHQTDTDILGNDTVLGFFNGIKRRGIARAIGASTYKAPETEAVIDSGVWDVIQFPFNLMDQRHQRYFSRAQENGVGIMIRSVLLKGLLSNRAENLHPALQDVKAHVKLYDSMLNGDFHDLPTLALKFALSFEQVSSVLVGMDRIEYLSRSVQSADGKYLTGKALQAACELAYPDPDFLDLPHWERMGWLT